MTTSKKDEADADAGLVPKGDIVTSTVDPDDTAEYDALAADDYPAVVDDGEITADYTTDTEDIDGDGIPTAVDTVPDLPPGVPPPVTPASTTTEQQHRVLYEDQINADARLFASRAEAAYIEAALAGRGIDIVVVDDDALTD